MKKVFLCAALLSGSVQALENNAQIHGFVSHAQVLAQGNQVGAASAGRWGTLLSEAGVNLSARPNADWFFNTQVSARWDGVSNGTPRVDVASAERTLLQSEHSSLLLQAGVLKNAYGFYNMSRDVVHTRPGIIMPTVYFEQARNALLSAPGVALEGRTDSGRNSFNWRVGALLPDLGNQSLLTLLLGPQAKLGGELTARTSFAGQLSWAQDDGRWRAAWSAVELNAHYTPYILWVTGIDTNVKLDSNMLSLEYNGESWSHTLEYARIRVLRDRLSGGFDRNFTLEQGYAQTQWRVSPGWQTWLRYDVTYMDAQDRGGLLYQLQSGQPASRRYVQDWSLGVRHDPSQNWTLSAEVHRVKGTAWLTLLSNPLASQRPNWDMLAVQAAYHF